MNPSATPFLRLLIPFTLGITLGEWLEVPIPFDKYLLVVIGGLLFWGAFRQYDYRQRHLFGVFYSLFLVGGGYCYVLWHNELNQPEHFSRDLPLSTQCIIGVVRDAPSKGGRFKIPICVESMGKDLGALQSVKGNLLLFVESSPKVEQIRYGDRISIRATIYPTESPRNPNAFNYQRYLHFKNIHYQAFVQPDSLTVLSSGHGSAICRYAFKWRDQLLSILQDHFPDRDEYAVASALLVGYQEDLSDDLRAAYAETGSMHALAVSGTHVSMLYAAIMFFLLKLPLYGQKGRLIETLIAMLLIWLFTFITGATASVLRASIMFSIFLVGRAFFRNSSIWNTLGTSAFVLILYDPYILFDAGFQLSYAAVAGMVYFYPLFYKYSPVLPKWLDECWKVLLVGFAAQLGTLPLSLLFFHQFPIYFWLAGWIVVFGGAVFMAAGSMLVILHATVPMLAKYLGWALYYMLWAMNQLVIGIQHLPGSVMSGIWLTAWASALLYIAIAFLGVGIAERRGKWMLASMSVVLVLLLCREFACIEHQGQKKMIVYSIQKGRLMDFFDGTSAISLSDTLTKKQVLFAAQPNRWAGGIRNNTTVYIKPDHCTVMDNLLYNHPFIQFFDKRMVLLDDLLWLKGASQIPTDILVISKNAATDIVECQKKFPAGIVVFDNTNSRRKVEKWVAQCIAEGIPFHDVRTQGAWVWSN